VTWRLACAARQVPADRGWPVRIGGISIAVFDLGDRLVAVENRCRHLANPIDDGLVEDGCVTCPWHGWRYDLRTGAHLTFFGSRPGVRTFPVRVEGDDVLVDID
jgi:nitrite reductase/ring-hydroxylating ferredoxin subunit